MESQDKKIENTSTVKTKVEQDSVLSFLNESFGESISNLEFLKGGESSQAFAFESKGDQLVIRVNNDDVSFKKDAYVEEHFSLPTVPVPHIIEIGKFDERYFYCISKKAEGKTVNNLSEDEYQKVLPEMLSILDSVHAVDIRDTSGYGKWDFEHGIGEFDSWKESILSVNMYVKDGVLFEKSFLEKDIWDRVYAKIEQLVDSCPEDRYLIHGDYGSDNVVSDGEKVTGVLDWAASRYGDFLYDVAWLSFWGVKNDPQKKVENIYRNKNIPNFEERLLCYKLRIGLGSLSFYAYSNQKDKYDLIKQRVLDLL
jgi:hygromycin-B 4-O-kinase